MNFTEGKEPFGIIVALADGGEAVAGWLYDPVRDRLCHARTGAGAFVDGERIAARTTGETRPVAAVSRMFLSAEEVAGVMGANWLAFFDASFGPQGAG